VTLTRRELLRGAVGTSATLVLGCGPAAQAIPTTTTTTTGEPTMTFSPALAADHTVVPLPFGPTSLTGISERMIVSHHDNNYAGAVRNLNVIETQLRDITADTPPPVVVALRERELTFRNSKTLHEAYFANLGGSGARSGSIETALTESYGTSARWEEHFRFTAAGLGGGSGWVVLGYELETGLLRTSWSGGHTQALATSMPLLVLDMYEHAYQMDYGAAAARYIDAFFANVKWDEVNARLERAMRLGAIARGA
jgi:Fe-Mn family superoxide dismutase